MNGISALKSPVFIHILSVEDLILPVAHRKKQHLFDFTDGGNLHDGHQFTIAVAVAASRNGQEKMIKRQIQRWSRHATLDASRSFVVDGGDFLFELELDDFVVLDVTVLMSLPAQTSSQCHEEEVICSCRIECDTKGLDEKRSSAKKTIESQPAWYSLISHRETDNNMSSQMSGPDDVVGKVQLSYKLTANRPSSLSTSALISQAHPELSTALSSAVTSPVVHNIRVTNLSRRGARIFLGVIIISTILLFLVVRVPLELEKEVKKTISRLIENNHRDADVNGGGDPNNVIGPTYSPSLDEKSLDDQLQERLEKGLALLRNDPAGAEAVCASLSREYADNVDARVCAAEARLSLHVLAMKQSSSSAIKADERLIKAHDDLAELTENDPALAAARAGLGIALLLKASLVSPSDVEYYRYLFDSSLHFSAASSLAATGQSESSFWNAAIAQIMLSEPTSASVLLQKALDINPSDPSLLANLGTSLLDGGDIDGSVALLQNVNDVYCNNNNRATSKYDTSHHKLCAMVTNNLGVAIEAASNVQCSNSGASCVGPSDRFYKAAIQWDPHCNVAKVNYDRSSQLILEQVDTDFPPNVSNNSKSEKKIDNTDILEVKGVKSSANNRLEYKDALAQTPSEFVENKDKVGTLARELRLALDTLERAVLQDPSRSRLWIGLARARAHARDYAGAVDASAKAVGMALGKEELDAATMMLEESIDRIAPHELHGSKKLPGDLVSEQDFVTMSELSTLRLELEIQSLKLQLLQSDISKEKKETWISETSYSVEKQLQVGGGEGNLGDIHAAKIEDNAYAFSGAKLQGQRNVHSEGVEMEKGKGINAPPNDEEVGDPESMILLRDVESTRNRYIDLGTSVHDEDATSSKNEVSLIEKLGERTDAEESKAGENVTLSLPVLFEPKLSPAKELQLLSASYMKLASAYFDKENLSQAMKEYQKVLSKAPEHLPALIGYARTLELVSNNMTDIAMAFGDAGRIAVIQGEGEKSEALLRHAIDVARTVGAERISLMLQLCGNAHTPLLAADTYYFIGLELLRQGDEESPVSAKNAFLVANNLVEKYAKAEGYSLSGVHGLSLVELGRLTVTLDGNVTEAKKLLMQALGDDWDDNGANVYCIMGNIMEGNGDVDGAIAAYNSALELSESEYLNGEIHHQIALALSKVDSDENIINAHFEKALEGGMEASLEAINALGENNQYVRVALLMQKHARNTESENKSPKKVPPFNYKDGKVSINRTKDVATKMSAQGKAEKPVSLTSSLKGKISLPQDRNK